MLYYQGQEKMLIKKYAEGAVTPLIVNNNKYLARRSPSSLSQSYQCVNNTPTSDQMCVEQHLWDQDCQHSTIPFPCLVFSWQKRSNMKVISTSCEPRAHCRLLAAFICSKINKWSFLAFLGSHKQNIVWELRTFLTIIASIKSEGELSWASLNLGVLSNNY